MLTFENVPATMCRFQDDSIYIFRHQDDAKLAYRTPSNNVLLLDDFTDYDDLEAVTNFAKRSIDGPRVVAVKKKPHPGTFAIDILLTLAHRYKGFICFDLGKAEDATPIASKPL